MGHTVRDKELKYGMAVTGLVHPAKIWANQGAQPGDVLILTKPIGTGVLTTALKRGAINDQDLEPAVLSMAQLNQKRWKPVYRVTSMPRPTLQEMALRDTLGKWHVRPVFNPSIYHGNDTSIAGCTQGLSRRVCSRRCPVEWAVPWRCP